MLIGVAVVFVLLAAFGAWQAVGSLGPYRRVLRQPTLAIASLAPGPAEVAGTLRLVGPAQQTLDGAPAIAVRTTVSYTYRSGSKTYAGPVVLDELTATDAEISDATGTCSVDTTALMLIGERRRRWFAAQELQEKEPALWARLSFSDRSVVRVDLEQTWVPDGAQGLVSGEAETAGTEASDDYRGTRTRYRIVSTVDRPVILSAYPEAQARRVLLRPAWMFAMLAGLALGVAAALVAAARLIGG
jgi:hypothetical protein